MVQMRRTLTAISVLTRPEHLRQVFKDSDKHTKALNNNSGWLMSQVLGQCVGLISGEPWRKVRAVTEVPFLHKTVNEYVPLVQRQVRDYVDTLHETGRLQDELLDPAGDMKMLPFFVVAEIIYGHLDQDLVADLRKLAPTRERLFKHVIAGGPSRFPWSQFLPLGANKALRDFKAEWRRFNAKAYQRAVNAQTSSDTAAPIVRMYDAVRRAELSEEQLLQTLDESLYANLDVTTGALSWCIVFLASSAPTCQRLREEIANMRAKDGSQQVSYFLSSSTYLAASIAESSRLKPLAAFSVPQSAPTPRVIDGYLIPAHTDFMIDSYALNIRNDYWGPDRDVYRPERWFELKTTDLRYHFWRFGFGPRQCMGKYVADLILKCLMVHLLEEYELSIQKSEEKWQRDPESWITHPKMLLNCERRTR